MKDPIIVSRITKSGNMKISITLGLGVNLTNDMDEATVILEDTLIAIKKLATGLPAPTGLVN